METMGMIDLKSKWLWPLSFILCTLFFGTSVTACVDEEQFDNSPTGNFEALWQIIDQHYCFFDYKQHEYGLDWNAVYQKYKVRVNNGMTEEQLFEVLSNMIGELRDGHVNLYAAHDNGRYGAWRENYPSNFRDSLERRYLGTDYRIASGLKYLILDDNIGYIRYNSFSTGFGESNLNEVMNYLITCQGLIIDIRGNGGGTLTYADMLAARFVNERVLVGYLQHKTGTGHSDFSAMEPKYIEPSSHIRWHKNVCLLTNREVFSAANEFAMMMKALPRVKLVGDHTGGGAGMPFSSSLPNGWIVRFSAVPMYDAQRQTVEFGMDPDYEVGLTDEDVARGRDTIIEFARKLLAK